MTASEPDTAARERLVRLEWRHPRLGQIDEILCARHEGEVLYALRMLGIGCGGEWAESWQRKCFRCQRHQGRGIGSRCRLRR